MAISSTVVNGRSHLMRMCGLRDSIFTVDRCNLSDCLVCVLEYNTFFAQGYRLHDTLATRRTTSTPYRPLNKNSNCYT
jgi:hypothetical protein